MATISYGRSVLDCAGQCLHKQLHGESCTAFQLEEESCRMIALTELRERTVADVDWPVGVFVSAGVKNVTELYCGGGDNIFK